MGELFHLDGNPVSLEALFSAMPVAMCLLDREGRHIALNEALANISGAPLEAHLGVPVSRFSEESARNIRNDFATLDAGGEVPVHEVEIRGKTYQVSVKGLRASAGHVIGLMVTLADISRAKATEQALAAANDQLRVHARIDHLTEIPNRRAFDETLEHEIQRALREDRELVLGMVDIDHFKRFNDSQGHLAGDECLRQVAQSLRASLRRAGDSVFRYGGEEFAIILPSMDSRRAKRLGQSITEGIAALEIPHAASPFGRVTISLGMASLQGLDRQDGSIDTLRGTLTAAADHALYQAKQHRNTVALHEGMTEERSRV